jgi:hypothetical protein
MASKGTTQIQRGQAITFRLPSDTPDHILRQLQKLKETERRNFSSTIAEFALEGVSRSISKERETLTIPLPKMLTREQRSWLKHSHSEALLGSIVYQLLADPVRASSILASLNSNSLDIDQALYLQEEEMEVEYSPAEESLATFREEPIAEEEDDLLHFNWESVVQEQAAAVNEENESQDDVEDLLGGFLASMNK